MEISIAYVAITNWQKDREQQMYDKASVRSVFVCSKTKCIIYGDAIRETSTDGIKQNSWYSDYSYFVGYYTTFFDRGGYLWNGSGAGLFSFTRRDGYSYYYIGFRSILIAK